MESEGWSPPLLCVCVHANTFFVLMTADPPQGGQGPVQPAQHHRHEAGGRVFPPQPGRGRAQVEAADCRRVLHASLQ